MNVFAQAGAVLENAQIKMTGRNLTFSELRRTPEGRHIICQKVVAEISSRVMNGRLARDRQEQFCLRAHSAETNDIDRVFEGMVLKPNVSAPAAFSGCLVSMLAIFHFSVVRLQSKVVVFTADQSIVRVNPLMYWSKENSPNYLRNESNRMKVALMRNPVKMFEAGLEIQYGLFDTMREFCLEDVINAHLKLNRGQGVVAKTIFPVPYTEELFAHVFDAARNGNTQMVDLTIPFFRVIIDNGYVHFSSLCSGRKFAISCEAYVELFVRAYVALSDAPVDVQIEVDSTYYGWRVMKMTDVEKNYRSEAEYIITKVHKDNRSTRLVHGFDYRYSTLTKKTFEVDGDFYYSLYKTVGAFENLVPKDIMQLVEARNYVTIAKGPLTKESGLYGPDVLIAVTQTLFREEFQRRFDTGALISAWKGEGSGVFKSEHVKSLKGAFLIFGGLACTVGLLNVLLTVGTVAPPLYSLMNVMGASATIVKGVGIFSSRLLGILKALAEKRTLPRSEDLVLPDTISELKVGELGKPIVLSSVLTKHLKLSSLIPPKKLLSVWGHLYEQVSDGDVFDLDGKRYVRYDQAVDARDILLTGEKLLFSKSQMPGIEHRLGEVCCSRETFKGTLVGYYKVDDGDFRRVFTNGFVDWINGKVSDLSIMCMMPLTDKVAKVVSIVSLNMSDVVKRKEYGVALLDNEVYMLIPYEGKNSILGTGIMAPFSMSDYVLKTKVKDRFKLKDWLCLGYVVDQHEVLSSTEIMKRKGRWDASGGADKQAYRLGEMTAKNREQVLSSEDLKDMAIDELQYYLCVASYGLDLVDVVVSYEDNEFKCQCEGIGVKMLDIPFVGVSGFWEPFDSVAGDTVVQVYERDETSVTVGGSYVSDMSEDDVVGMLSEDG